MIICPLSGLPGKDFRITQRVGDRPDYYKKYGLAGHNGIDLAPPKPNQKGIIIYAPHDGFVKVGNNGNTGYGKFVRITSEPANGQRRQSDLGHFESIFVKTGQYVSLGDPLGIMGSSGDSTAIHCHFGYRPLKADGTPLLPNNGLHGVIDVSKFTLLWFPGQNLSGTL